MMTDTQNQISIGPDTTCWSCSRPVHGGHFCALCGKVQPLPRSVDYFAFMGLPQKLSIATADLEQRFHQLSWKLHPDIFVRASAYERNLSLERSSELNDAYRTLRDPIARMEYLLGRAGVRKEGAAKQQAPPELLEEVFELNESLDELRAARAAGADLEQLRARLGTSEKDFRDKLTAVDAELQGVTAAWDATLDTGATEIKRDDLMTRMNDILNRRSYIRNLVAGVQKELAEA
jgi:molecular chaperone HscB